MVRGRYRRDAGAPVTDTGPVLRSRKTAGLLVAAGLWPLLVWPNFVRVVATDGRAFDGGRPTAYLIVHVALAVVSMGLGVALLVLGVRGWRRATRGAATDTGSAPGGVPAAAGARGDISTTTAAAGR